MPPYRKPAVLIQHGVGAPTRQDVHVVEPMLRQGMYYNVDNGKNDEGGYTVAAYLYEPEHADKAMELLTRQYQEEQAMRQKHAGEWNLLSPWRFKP